MSEQTPQTEQSENTRLPLLGGNDPFKGVVTLLISLTVILIAVVSYLIGDIKEYATIAIRDVTQYSIQAMGEKGNYDFILDSRSIMYAKKDSDITDQVIAQLNK